MEQEFHAFSFFISVINFGVMFFLFYHVVIGPMEDAVALRQKRVQARLDEIRKTLLEAQSIKDTVAAQVAKVEVEKQEMREATEREILRVQEQLSSKSARDAEHLVAKAGREAEKNRVDTLAALNRQLTGKALSKVEGLLTQALDNQAQQASAQLVLGKVGNRAN